MDHGFRFKEAEPPQRRHAMRFLYTDWICEEEQTLPSNFTPIELIYPRPSGSQLGTLGLSRVVHLEETTGFRVEILAADPVKRDVARLCI